MSIFASTVTFDTDDHSDNCARWVPIPGGDESEYGVISVGDCGRFYLADNVACTCNAGPIRYQGSHVLPSDGDDRGGYVALAEIPGFIDRPGRSLCGPDNECDKPATECCDRVWPWLRLSLDGGVPPSTVLLDRDQVEAMHAYLGRWLERAPKGQPT